jgi:hypothetical protein
MRSHATKRFWDCFAALPPDVQRIGLHWRALGVRSDDTMIWYWIGSQAEYDRLLSAG